MNIMMLGHSKAGKTTFMSALYHRMSNGVYNYKMRYDSWVNYLHKKNDLHIYNYTTEEARKERDALIKSGEDLLKGIYPSPTCVKQEYVFNIQYGNYKDIQFNWYDYRGGALNEKAGSDSDVNDLMSKIKKSDALIVFLDGTQLEEPLPKNERSFRRLIYLIKNAISEVRVDQGDYFPISFVITKDDLCDDVLNSEGWNYFEENIFQDIKGSSKIAALVTWVTINETNIYNVHWPLFFSLFWNIDKYMDAVLKAYQKRDNDRGTLDRIREWWTDEDKNNTIRIYNEIVESGEFLKKTLVENKSKYFITF